VILQEALIGSLHRVRAERRLSAALAASLLLHAAVLLPPSWAVPARQIVQIAQPLFATLRTSGVETTATPPNKPVRRVEPVMGNPEEPTVAPKLAAVAPKAAVATAAGAPARSRMLSEGESLAAIAKAQPRQSDAYETSRTAGVQNNVAAPAPNVALTEQEIEGLDAEAVRQYRFGLARAVTKRYPQQAVERGWAGTAQVRVTVAREGLAREVELSRSSGHGILDAEAKAMVSQAVKRTVVPEPLRGHEFAVDLPVRFDLHDAEQ